jgi:hypothetical protein
MLVSRKSRLLKIKSHKAAPDCGGCIHYCFVAKSLLMSFLEKGEKQRQR